MPWYFNCSFPYILLLKPKKTCQWDPFSLPAFVRLLQCIVAYSGHLVNTGWALDSGHLGCDIGSISDKKGGQGQALHVFGAQFPQQWDGEIDAHFWELWGLNHQVLIGQWIWCPCFMLLERKVHKIWFGKAGEPHVSLTWSSSLCLFWITVPKSFLSTFSYQGGTRFLLAPMAAQHGFVKVTQHKTTFRPLWRQAACGQCP